MKRKKSILAGALRRAREQGRGAFIPYVTAGDPSLEWTGKFLEGLARAGADVVELGVPFSDPIADGPVNQRAAERALASRVTLVKILDFTARLRRRGFSTPIVLFTYYNPVLRMGLEGFAARAASSGVQGVLIVDLPPEEAEEYRKILDGAGLEAVFLASPTTSADRLRKIDRASTGFIYYAARLGVTGVSRDLSRTLGQELARLRRHARGLVAVGFGISTPRQAKRACAHADAVVMGSALVGLIERHGPREAAARMERLAARCVAALRGKR